MNPGVVPTNEFYGDSDARSGEGQHSLLKLPDYRESFFSGSHGLPTENNGKPNHFMQKVEKISGLDNLEPVNDMILYRESEETGAILVRLGSDNMLEEDLSLISEEGFFTKEEIDNITRNAFADLLTRLGTYVDPDRLHYLFPGLDLEKVQEYNFADSRIRMFVLPSFVHQEIHTIIFDDHQFSGASYATTIRSHTKRKSETSVEYVNISERTLIVMNETYVYEGIFQNKDIHPYGLKSTEKDIAEFYLYVGMIHEIIHKLGLFDDMNPSISEGMVELWANFVARDKYADRPEILEEAYITCYVSNTDALVIFMSILQHDGFDLKSLEQAFLAENNLVREKIFSHLIEIFGEEDVLKIFSVNFDSEEQFWNHIAKLYRKMVGPVAGTPSVGYPPRSPAATKIANFVGKVTKRMRPRLYPGIRINRFLEKERSG